MICTPHRGSNLTYAHLSCPYMQCVCFSSTLSSPFHPTSSSSHSSSISCSPSCTSTTLRVVLTLRTSPERRWTLLTNPTSSQFCKHQQKRRPKSEQFRSKRAETHKNTQSDKNPETSLVTFSFTSVFFYVGRVDASNIGHILLLCEYFVLGRVDASNICHQYLLGGSRFRASNP